jgi:hypothetical protein
MSPIPVVAAARPAASTPKGPPSTSPTSAMAAARPAASAPPEGPPSTSPTPVVAAVGPATSAPPGGPPSMSPTPVVAAAGPAASTPRGAAIDVSNSGGGHYRTYRQHPPGGLPSTSPTLGVAAARPADSSPQGSDIDVSLNLVPAARIFLATPTRGATVVNITTTSKQFGGKLEARVWQKKNRILAMQEPGSHNTITEVNQQTV